jgi:hypothetical protein
MGKRIPFACTQENCGDNYYRCGKRSCYTNGGCRCEACTKASQEYTQRQYHSDPEKYRAKTRDRRRENPEAAREKDRIFREANRELANERTRDWRRRNPGKATAATQRWLENNPENKLKYRTNRASRIDAAWLEDVDVIVVYERDNWTCQSCGIKCSPTAKRGEPGCPSLDHVIPLSVGIFRGGFHSYANTQLLCHSCNCKKKDKTPK